MCEERMPFYVGKGTQMRVMNHLSETTTPPSETTNLAKYNKVRRVLAAQGYVSCALLRASDETSALCFERYLMNQYDNLTNQVLYSECPLKEPLPDTFLEIKLSATGLVI
jgi:hypothetical protein